jgi:hypothetical protein
MDAAYSVIRYIADPARNEPLNVGILVWGAPGYRLQIDTDALDRVIRDHPQLERDALLCLEDILSRDLAAAQQPGVGWLEELIHEHSGFPIQISDPRYTTIEADSEDALDATLARLAHRVVHPRRRFGASGVRPVDRIARELNAWIRSSVVTRDFVFANSRSGVPRSVDFFANSGRNVAVDALKLSLARGQEIKLRADAQAFKVEDIRTENAIRYVVYCEFSNDHRLGDVNGHARKIIESAGAAILTEPTDVVTELESALTERR